MSLVIGGPLVARRCEVPAKRSHRASSRRLRVHHCCQMLQGEEQPLLGRDPPILGSQLRHRAALMLRLPRSWRTCSAPRSSTWAALRLSEICSLASGCTAGRAGQGFRRPLLPLFDVTSPRLSSPALKKFSNSSHRNRIYLKYNVLTFYSYLTIKFISSTKTHLRVVPVTKIGEGTRVFK